MNRSAKRFDTGMGDVTELRLVLTVSDFDAAIALYRDALGLEEVEAWAGEAADAHIAILDAGRATLELVNEPQAEAIDRIEVGHRVAGPVRIAFKVGDSELTAERLSRPAPNSSPPRSPRPGTTGTFACVCQTACS
jgi:lactoylglutathione lyase